MEIEIKIYQDQAGKEPFSNWLLKLDSKTQDIIIRRLNRVREGNFGDCKNLGNEIYELRFFFGSGYRIYFGKEKKTIVILLCGGDKTSQSNDIKKAKQYWRNYNEKK